MITLTELKELPQKVYGQCMENYWKAYEAIPLLIEEVEQLRKALEKYANPETHSMDEDGFLWSGDYFDYKTAQKALTASKERLP